MLNQINFPPHRIEPRIPDLKGKAISHIGLEDMYIVIRTLQLEQLRGRVLVAHDSNHDVTGMAAL